MDFTTRLKQITSDYARNYGQIKLEKIISKVENSNSVNKALNRLNELNTYPRSEDIVATVMNMPSFMFGKKESIVIAGLIFLLIWHNKLNTNYKYLDEHDLLLMIDRVFYQCNQMV